MMTLTQMPQYDVSQLPTVYFAEGPPGGGGADGKKKKKGKKAKKKVAKPK
jgi:hypothetical protein